MQIRFWKKLQYVDDPNDLSKYFDLAQLKLPDAVFKRRVAKEAILPIFGVSLELGVKRRPPTESGTPVVVEKCLESLKEKGMKTEGLFRVSATVKQINLLKKSFDKGEDVDFNLIDDPHVISCVLKQYLRDLPEPLIPFNQYSNFLGIQGLRKCYFFILQNC